MVHVLEAMVLLELDLTELLNSWSIKHGVLPRRMLNERRYKGRHTLGQAVMSVLQEHSQSVYPCSQIHKQRVHPKEG